ncbi:protein ALP1-like [Temnothorax curvispinosus]|uniref:Protein ALP1-like n=1 Tax=Temnothorax curvispinosus TaxID=300111 RepID=A0A6J1Q3N8_9HYME|nr:protein ALP1-like [Temnothorax curvispinosus]XP_024876787.1 protein ALP1-like [Temnothorax curvispinosus]XP_024876788.1 protein ALP1-like [Temnothorax curvispinosus]XP_024876790.1 protein ALP1-like [Temnothorax curvispinosus]
MQYLQDYMVATMGLVILRRKKSQRWLNRQWWVRPINCMRPNQGDFCHLLQEIKDDPQMFFRYTRMTVPIFNKLLEIMRPSLIKRSHRALVPEERLAITLRYLATGDQILSIALAYRIRESTAYSIIKETCNVFIKILAPDYLRPPMQEEWINICHGFWRDWNFPNCVGAVDGKHIHIQAPPNSGSLYYNYKKTFSIVLMAACDQNYKFTLVDVGAYGSNNNDAGVFSRSEFEKALHNQGLDLPQGVAKLPGSETETPCFFVGDDAFQLTRNMMKPYAGRNLSQIQKIFNYRLSRARRTIENAFGILASRWRVFRKPICMNPVTVDKIVMACVCLHNFLKTENDALPVRHRLYCPPNFVDSKSENGDVVPGE